MFSFFYFYLSEHVLQIFSLNVVLCNSYHFENLGNPHSGKQAHLRQPLNLISEVCMRKHTKMYVRYLTCIFVCFCFIHPIYTIYTFWRFLLFESVNASPCIQFLIELSSHHTISPNFFLLLLLALSNTHLYLYLLLRQGEIS